MGNARRTRLLRALATLAVGAAVAVAVALADRSSESTLDAPAGGLTEPAFDLELVVDEPAGGDRPRGLVWLLCCGAWRPPETHGLDIDLSRDRARLGATAWRQRGYRVATFAAIGGGSAVAEALAAFDRLRAENPGLPICAFGASAAGHMALMVAASRDELRCVVAHSAPTALADLPSEPIPGVLPQPPRSLAEETFGEARLDELSPLRHAGDIDAAVRLASCSDDRIVPQEQARRMARALERRGVSSRVELAVLDGETVRVDERPPRGRQEIIHQCFISAAARRRDDRETARFIESELAER